MLREDEVFRLAVVGLLGISDVQSSLRQLVNAVGDLTRTVQRLVEGQERLWEENRRINENIERIWREIRALHEGQERLWQENNRIWQEIRRINENIEKLWQENNKIWRELRGGIRRTLEHVTLSIEEEANDVVQYFLRQRGGVVVETRPTHLNARFEFDVYGTNGRLTIVGEAKTRASPQHC